MKNIGKSLETLSAATNDESDMMSGLAEEEIKRQRKALESANISIENRKKLLDELDKYEIKINADREKRAEESAAKLVASAQKEAEEKLKAAKGKSSEGGVEITDAESESVKNFISGEKQKLEAMEINADKKKELIEKLADLEQKLDDQIAANAEKNENRKLEGKKAALSASQDLLQTGLEFIKQGYEEESNKYEIEKERQLSALQKQKDSGAITEKQYQENQSKKVKFIYKMVKSSKSNFTTHYKNVYCVTSN